MHVTSYSKTGPTCWCGRISIGSLNTHPSLGMSFHKKRPWKRKGRTGAHLLSLAQLVVLATQPRVPGEGPGGLYNTTLTRFTKVPGQHDDLQTREFQSPFCSYQRPKGQILGATSALVSGKASPVPSAGRDRPQEMVAKQITRFPKYGATLL